MLKTDEKNVKAYFRLTNAYEKKGDLEEAYESIKMAVKVQQESGKLERSIRDRYVEIKEKYAKEKESLERQRRDLYGKMLGKEQVSAKEEVAPGLVAPNAIA